MIANAHPWEHQTAVGEPYVSSDSNFGATRFGSFVYLMVVVIHDLDSIADQAMIANLDLITTFYDASVVDEAPCTNREARTFKGDDPYSAIQRAETDAGAKFEIALNQKERRTALNHDPVSDLDALESQQS
ncbi:MULTISPECIES: hypothetical protein [unclassified Novosphingobium]|uniref:hypothetical protein n=1 Tax=unclassified Novosphingobium TaxID=2644732 RepID=UPI0025E6C1EC|nr:MULTISPECIES: hypothetical protein [unclassified Novosphingobium]